MARPPVPVPLRILALLYALSAAWCAGWITQASSTDKPMFFPATLLALLAVPVAIGLFLGRRAAYVALFIHAGAWVVIGVLTTFFVKEHTEYLVFAIGHVVLVAAPFLMRRSRAAFFGGAPTRSEKRHDIHLQSHVEVEGARRVAETGDLSEHGAYVAMPTDGLKVGQRIVVQMHLRANKFLRLPAHVVAIDPKTTDAKMEGAGVHWSHLTEHDKENIAHFISEGLRQNKMRTPFKLKATFVWERRNHTCDVYNLSPQGCYIDDKETVLQPGDQVSLNIHLYEGDTVEVLAEVMWLPGDATIVAVTHFVGSALEFRGLSKKDAGRIEERLAQVPGPAET